MRLRRLALAAIAGLAIFPMSGAMAASPGTTDLPQALANPVEPDFVETTSNRSGDLVGYFDAGAFAQWAGTDAGSRQAFRDMLTSRGFVTGYQRIWSRLARSAKLRSHKAGCAASAPIVLSASATSAPVAGVTQLP